MEKIKISPKHSKILKAVMEKGIQSKSSATWTQSHSVHSNHNKSGR